MLMNLLYYDLVIKEFDEITAFVDAKLAATTVSLFENKINNNHNNNILKII